MPRPALELADIFRQHGEAYRQQHRLPRHQLRLMRAIEICRTATLGGHVDECDQCGRTRHSYNSCLMGSFSLWGLREAGRHEHDRSRPFGSPLRLGLQERKEFVRRPEPTLAKTRRQHRLNGFELFTGIGTDVNFGGRQIAMAQPQ